MKKTTTIFAFIFFICFAYEGFCQKKKVAVVTFYVNKEIDASQMGSGAQLMKSIATLADDPSFDLTPVLGNFHDVFFNEYSKSFPFDLLPEESVTGKAEYKSYESKFKETKDKDRAKWRQGYITSKGYKPLSNVGLKKENRNSTKMLEMFGKEADGVMFVFLSYQFVPKMAVGGMGSAGIKGYVNIKLFNKEGKKVFGINEGGMSTESVAMVKGIPIMKKEKIQPMCESASNKIIKDLTKKLPKIAKKAAAKL